MHGYRLYYNYTGKELEENLKKPKKSDDCEKPGNANESEPASNMHFFATDIDPNTLKVAHENAKTSALM